MRSLWIFLLACGSSPSPAEEDPCARAWESQRQAVLTLHEDAGKPPPTLPSDEDAIAACRALNLTPEQWVCLDPHHAIGHREGCDEVLPVEARAPWNDWLVRHIPDPS